jgi:hypothetical protein
MFGKIAADALGLSDIGVIVPPSDYNKVDADDYLFHEDGEKIFFLIKSRKDEYCFTNFAVIHVDGDSAVSSKRSIKRYDFSSTRVSNVTIETAGTVDRDVELKFMLDTTVFSIDVKKSFIEPLKDIYKALIAIGRQQLRDEAARSNAGHCLGAVAAAFKISASEGEQTLSRQFDALLGTVNDAVLNRHTTRDFSALFEKYIHA